MKNLAVISVKKSLDDAGWKKTVAPLFLMELAGQFSLQFYFDLLEK